MKKVTLWVYNQLPSDAFYLWGIIILQSSTPHTDFINGNSLFLDLGYRKEFHSNFYKLNDS